MPEINSPKGYVVCPVEQRQSLLLELLCRHYDSKERAWNRKIVLVFCHDNSIRFYTELFQRLKQLPIMPLMKANLTSAGGLDDYEMFLESETGVLAVSNTIAEQLPNLTADKIVQYEPPHSQQAVYELSSKCEDYLLFVRPEETAFIQHLQKHSKKHLQQKLKFEEQFVPWDAVIRLPKQKIQSWYKSLHSLNIHSKHSYKAYMDSIRDHDLNDIYNLNGVLIKEVAAGYCLPVPPYYKLVDETSRYQLEEKRKLQKASEPIPASAMTVQTIFKRVVRKDDTDDEALMRKLQSKKDKKASANDKLVRTKPLTNEDVAINEDGTVELGRDVAALYHYNKRKQRVLSAKSKKADLRGLRKMMRKSDGTFKTSSRIGNQKRRRPIKFKKDL